MPNIIDYIKKYGKFSFEEKDFCEVDNLVLSLFSYIDFSLTEVDDRTLTIGEAARQYFAKFKQVDVNKCGVGIKDAYKVFKLACDTRRFGNIIIQDYRYLTSPEMQFGAVSLKLRNDLTCISFEGTDDQISAWREDVEFACSFPVPAHIEAMNFLNKNISILGPKVIVCGHSKGGNLALVASMFAPALKRKKILKIYSNDGPGLRRREFESKEYQSVRDRYVHFVPEYTYFGVMLRNDIFNTIKSSSKMALCHQLTTWEVFDDKLKKGILSDRSLKLKKSTLDWLDKHNDAARRKFERAIFGVLEESGATKLQDLIDAKRAIRIARSIKNIDEESRRIIIDFIKNGILNLS